jgi:hypothetical protein
MPRGAQGPARVIFDENRTADERFAPIDRTIRTRRLSKPVLLSFRKAALEKPIEAALPPTDATTNGPVSRAARPRKAFLS